MTRLGAGVRPATAEERAGPPPTALDIRRAAQRIEGRVRRTPVLRLGPGERIAQPVWLKLECLQLTGSFKVRNAFAFLLATEVPEAGVMAVSGGNFGLAMAYAARALGHRITVFVPELAPKVKIDGIRALGAAVEVVSGPMSAIFSASEERIARTGALFVHPYDQHEIMAGAGTCGLEFDEQRPGLDTVLVAVGGGGLIGGSPRGSAIGSVSWPSRPRGHPRCTRRWQPASALRWNRRGSRRPRWGGR
jgi:threonine dehydratase